MAWEIDISRAKITVWWDQQEKQQTKPILFSYKSRSHQSILTTTHWYSRLERGEIYDPLTVNKPNRVQHRPRRPNFPEFCILLATTIRILWKGTRIISFRPHKLLNKRRPPRNSANLYKRMHVSWFQRWRLKKKNEAFLFHFFFLWRFPLSHFFSSGK